MGKKFNCFASIKTFKQINKNGRNAAPREWSTLTKIDAVKYNFKLKHLLVTMLLMKFFNSRCCEVAEHQMFQQFIKLLTSLNFQHLTLTVLVLVTFFQFFKHFSH